LKNAERTAPRFFDALRIAKGPNLGTNFSLCCPYTILAHYNELEFVERCGISRYLVRVSVGLEEADWLIGRFLEALERASQEPGAEEPAG
jgi:cystathionine gamma-synthase